MQFRNILILLFIGMNLFQCDDSTKVVKTNTPSDSIAEPAKAETINLPRPKVYEKFEDMAHIFEMENDTTYLINFWATWCKPCVKELPLFERLLDDFDGEKYMSILVSLDFPKKIESKLIPFIKNNKLKSEVIVLTDGKQQEWIDKVDKEWDGAIPVTLIYKKDKSKFLYGEVHNYEALKKEVETIMNH